MTKLPTKTLALIIEQLTMERHANAAYSAIAASLSTTPFLGFAKWFYAQGKEELDHAERVFNYIIERGAEPKIEVVEEVAFATKKPTESMNAAAELEASVTEHLVKVGEAAESEGDPLTCQFLIWFLEEQRKSEAVINDFIKQLQLAEGDNAALYLFDHEIGELAEKE